MSLDHVGAFHVACHSVLMFRQEKAVRYAVGYAEAGTFMTDPETIRVQCLYILNNITHWRGPVAKQARMTFKRLSETKGWN